MAHKEEEMDIREEMRIALFWRGLIGDAKYNSFDPDDLLRWYEALELRGPDEIRAVKNERYFTTQTGVMLGVVGRAPHPPLWLINEWLEHYEQKIHTGGYWAMAGCFFVITGIFVSNLQGCANLQPMNQLAMQPPAGTPAVAPYAAPSTYANGMTNQGIPAAAPNTAMPPATPTATGPQSNGIAGAASGMVPASGVTGPQNIGASAGVVQGGGGSAPP